MKFILCIPAHNEADVIGKTLEEIGRALQNIKGLDYSVVVAENASTDKTAETAAASGIPNASVEIMKQKGKGAAIRECLSGKQNGDYFGFTDVDLSVEPVVIRRMLDILSSGKADLVIGSRFHHQTKSDRGFLRTLSSKIFNGLARLITGVTHNDTQCPIKIMNRKGLRQLLESGEEGYFMDLEFIRRCELSDVRIVEIPINWRENYYAERISKISLVRDGVKGLKAMFRIRKNIKKNLKTIYAASGI